MKYGICHLGVVVKRNDHKSELVCKLLYGEAFKIIDQRKDWYKIRLLWDAYQGWITQHQATLIEESQYKINSTNGFFLLQNLIDFVHLNKEEIIPVPLGSDLKTYYS